MECPHWIDGDDDVVYKAMCSGNKLKPVGCHRDDDISTRQHCDDMNWFEEPYSAEGWWDNPIDLTVEKAQFSSQQEFEAVYTGDCPKDRLHRDTCHQFEPCTPAESCTGNNACSVGYQYNMVRCRERIEEWVEDPSTGEDVFVRALKECTTDSDCNPDGGKCG